MKSLTLTISLILGLATAVSADDILPPAYKILGEGKILHKEVHYQKDSKLYYNDYPFNFLNQIVFIQYAVLHRGKFYECWIRHKHKPDDSPKLDLVSCRNMEALPTISN